MHAEAKGRRKRRSRRKVGRLTNEERATLREYPWRRVRIEKTVHVLLDDVDYYRRALELIEAGAGRDHETGPPSQKALESTGLSAITSSTPRARAIASRALQGGPLE